MSEPFVAHTQMGPMKLESGPIRKEKDDSYSQIRKSPKVLEPDPPPPESPQRTVFLAVLPGTWALFSPSHQGTSMFSTHSAAHGPFPGIQAIGDIQGNRRWVVGVLPYISLSPTRADFGNAAYFHCHGERRQIDISQLEAWQPVGTTNLTNDEIERQEQDLWREWTPADYDWRLWNSQNFSFFLAVLVILPASTISDGPMLRSIYTNLCVRQGDRMEEVLLRRHLTSMAGMAVLGVATGGIGAFASWGFAAFNMIETTSVGNSHAAKLANLIARFPALRPLVFANNAGSGSGG